MNVETTAKHYGLPEAVVAEYRAREMEVRRG